MNGKDLFSLLARLTEGLKDIVDWLNAWLC